MVGLAFGMMSGP